MSLTPPQYKQMKQFLESDQRNKKTALLQDDLEPGPLKDELKGTFDPTQETYEEYLRRINLAEGGRIGFRYAGPVSFENILRENKDGTFSIRLYEGLDKNGKRIEKTYRGTRTELKKIFDEKNKSRVKGDVPVAKDSEIYKIRQGKNKGKFSIRMPKEDKRSIYDTKAEAKKHKRDYLNDPANKRGKPGPRKVDAPTGFVTGEEMLKAAKEKNIFVSAGRDPSNFATVFEFPKKMVKRKNFYDISKLDIQDEVDKILKAQVRSGSATDFAKKKFPVKTKSELQKPRLDAIEAKGGIRKMDPFAAPRGSGAQLGHTGNIFGTELITGDKLAYTPTQVNELMSRKGNLDDKIRTVSAKAEKIKKSNKSPKVKKDLLKQTDNILIRLASQSQGFKKVTLSGGGEFGGDRLTIDPLDIYKGKTQQEIVQLQKQYLNKPIITEEMAVKNPNLKVTPPEEVAKIQDAYFFEENRKSSLKAAQQFPKQELKKIIATLSADPRCKTKGFLNQGGRVGFQDGSASLDVCFRGGIDNINRGLPNPTAAQARNFGRVAAFGRNVVKFGILPEALFIAGESVIRMGMGDSLPESILRASEYLLPGNQTKLADRMMLARTVGPKTAELILKANELRGFENQIQSLENEKQFTGILTDDGFDDNFFGQTKVEEENIIQKQIDALKKRKESYGALTEAQYQFADAKAREAEDIKKSRALFPKLLAKARSVDIASDDPLAEAAKRTMDLDLKMLPSRFQRQTDLEFRKPMYDTLVNTTDQELSNRYTGQTLEDLKNYKDYAKFYRTQTVSEAAAESPEYMFGFQENFFGDTLDKAPYTPPPPIDTITGMESEILGQTNLSERGEVINPFDIDRSSVATGLRGFAAAGGGIAKVAGVDSGLPPSSGPNSQGLQGLMKRVKRI